MTKVFYVGSPGRGSILNIIDTWKTGEEIKGSLQHGNEHGFYIEQIHGKIIKWVFLPKNFSEEASSWFYSCLGQEFIVRCISFEKSNYTIERVQNES